MRIQAVRCCFSTTAGMTCGFSYLLGGRAGSRHSEKLETLYVKRSLIHFSILQIRLFTGTVAEVPEPVHKRSEYLAIYCLRGELG